VDGGGKNYWSSTAEETMQTATEKVIHDEPKPTAVVSPNSIEASGTSGQ
jgi:hypothetical protein